MTRDPDMVSPARAAVWFLATFVLVAAASHAVLAEDAPRAPVVVVVCDENACVALVAWSE